MVEQNTLDIGNQKIYTEALGAATNPPILLVSAAGSPGRFWSDSFCQHFVENEFFVIRYDQRDVGHTHTSEEPYELSDLAADAIGILDKYHIQAAHIVGHSMGAYTSQLLAAQYPNRILSLTLIAAGPIGMTPSMNVDYSEEEKKVLHETWVTMAANRPTQNFEESLEGFMGVWRRLNGKMPFDEQKARDYTEYLYSHSLYPMGPADKHLKVMEKVARNLESQKDIFSKIKSPVLIIQGAEDYLSFPNRGGVALAEAIKQATLEIIPNMGHMFFNDEAEKEVADHIIAFIQGIFIM